jgi:hypothetical protein
VGLSAIRLNCAANKYESLNFTKCTLPGGLSSSGGGHGTGEGAILEIRQGNSEWNFTYCTILSGSGFSGVRSDSTVRCEVRFCNFYLNHFSADSGVLSCARVGAFVCGCIFNNNTREFFLDVLCDECGFDIQNCVFSSILPIGSLYLSIANNAFETETATRFHSYFDTALCPATPYVASSTVFITSFSRVRRRSLIIVHAHLFDFVLAR